ncbi:hypothetical protein B9Z55_004551 [Caenorhabditis nigoni]|nr:hypothetical protein B9Z55_004551 [Caenorhabditis nigoni]
MGFWTVGEARVFQLWITNDPKEMPQVEKSEELTPLFISGILFLHYAFTLTFSVFILTCERACATFFIKDYEKKPRAYICITLLFLTHLTCFSLSCLATCEIMNFTTGVAISGIFIIGAVLIYFIILHINIGIQKRLADHDKQQSYYSLAIRFQAKENARSLELAKKVVLFASFAILCGMALLIVTALHLVDNHISTFVIFAEAAFNLNPLFIVPVGMYSVPTWRERFFKSVPIFQKLRTRKSNSKVSDTVEKNEAAKESEIYFNQLSAAWR